MPDYGWAALGSSLLWSLAAVVIVMAVTFAVARAVDRHAVIDVAWGLGFVAVALTAYVVSADDGDGAKRVLLLVLTAVWGLRLSAHIARRSRGKGEDPRYEALLAKATGSPTVYVITRVYLTQGVVMWFVSLPVQVGMHEVRGLTWLVWVGAAVWAVGLLFEAVSDHQLRRFRDDPASPGRVLETGLWRYSRHPNYFGDACVWWGLSLIAFSAWPGALTVLSPLLMTWLLARGTGKPLLEKDMTSRRPGYQTYIRRTSGFFPLPPRTASTTHLRRRTGG